MTRICAAVVIVVILVGCDSGLESENTNLRSENVKLSQQVAKLQAKIDKLQFQVDKLKNESQSFSAEIVKSRAKQYNPPKNEGDGEGTEHKLPKTITGKDGASMVLIPAGGFQMGTNPSKIPALVQQYKQYGAMASWFGNETPRHTIYVDAFYMDIYEVTNAQYKKFMDATRHTGGSPAGRSAPKEWDNYLDAPNQAVVDVSWYDAVAYAKWAGKRLPTEAEWEKAAHGRLVEKNYPWGDSEPDGTQCNFADKGTIFEWSERSVDDGYVYSAPVGSYSANGYGLYDMAGNVNEWCADWYDEKYYENSPRRNPKGPDSGNDRVLRGGAFGSDASLLRTTARNFYNPSRPVINLGFRCAMSRSD